ncbi:MAG: hypothetical protein JWQ69_1566 [Pseudomonas sp.]|nr:hypothetical protein [Pseudomonas sp.]
MSEVVADDVSSLNRLAHQAADLTINSEHGDPAVRLGLITTLYFKQGHTAHIKQRLEECFVRFRDEFKRELKWLLHKTERKLTLNSFTSSRRQVLGSSPDEQFIWSIGSGASQEIALYRMFVMNTTQALEEVDRSCLKMVLPWSILLEPEGVQRYEGWLKYLCEQVQAEHGFGGLAAILPHDGKRYFPLEYQLARQYIGLMVDPIPHIESLRLLDHIKGVGWYTVLGERFVDQLGGNDGLREQLSDCDGVVFQQYENGLIIRAGSLPVLDDEERLANYFEVNKVLKPIRIKDTGCLHPFPVQGGGFCETSTAQWYARFDEKPKPVLNAGDRCSHSGYWFSNARARSQRLFSKGDIMPAFAHLHAQRTHWFWMGEEV